MNSTIDISMKPFTNEQQYFIDTGRKNAERLQQIASTALGITREKYETKRHTYIYSPPGAGKTFTVNSTAEKGGVGVLKVQGAASLSALVVRLAVAAHCNSGDIVVWIDDCDTLFMDERGLNVMKGMLDEERNVLAYNLNLTSQILSYEKSVDPNDLIKAEALRSFQPEGGVGVEIPTNNMRIIVTSNKNLCPPADIHTKKGNKKLNMHEAAIRDRVRYEEFELTPEESWGWIAAVLLDNSILDLNAPQKQILLDWMWTNWKRLPATSVRAVKELAAIMLNNPSNYPDYWNAMLRKS